MALETFDIDDTLDDGEVYGQFTNQEGNSGNGYVESGKYKSYYDPTTYSYAFLITTGSIGITFNWQVEFRTSIEGSIYQACGIYLGVSPPSSYFDVDSTSTSLININLITTSGSNRLWVTRTTSGGSKQYWNFSIHAWVSTAVYWAGFTKDNDYRITVTRDDTNTVIQIYDITGATLIEEITSVNSDMKSISNNAYFYFGHPEWFGAVTSTVEWDNAGEVGGGPSPEDYSEEMMMQQIDG